MSFYSTIKLLSFLVHVALGLYVFRKAPRRRLNQAFFLTAISIAVMEFGYFMLLISSRSVLWMRIALVGQCLIQGNIVLFSLIYGRENYKDSLAAGKPYLIAAYSVSAVLIIAILSGVLSFAVLHTSADELTEVFRCGLIFSRTGLPFLVFLIICTLIALVNLENTYRQARQIGRRISYPAIVFAGMLAFHLLIYSWALGFSYARIDSLIVASMTLIIANVCIAYPVIRPEPGDSKIYVGRAVIAKSYTMLVAGIYLLVMGMMGKIVQIIGKNLNLFLAFLIAFFVVLVIMAIILSKSLKRQFQSFIERNFYRSKYDYRTEWENFSKRVFSTSISFNMKELLQEILNTVSEAMDTDVVSIMLLDERKGELVAANPWDDSGAVSSISAGDVFLDWLWRYGSPVKIDNGQCKADQISTEPLDIPSELLPALKSDARNSASGVLVPIIAEHRLIAIMILGKKWASAYFQEDMDLLETMANQISIAITNARASQELATSRQLESLHKLSAMLLHDLKSSASMLSLVIQNAADNFDNPEFQKDALSTMSNVVNRIQKLILKFSTAPQETKFQPVLQLVDLNRIVSGAVARSGVKDIAGIKVEEELGAIQQLMLDPENIERVIFNLILNAIEAIDNEGIITIRTYEEKIQDSEPTAQGTYGVISISDTGCGMTQEFIRDRLFQPFQTSKEKGLGIGLYQCKTIVDTSGGVMDVQSRQGIGSTFAVKLPILNVCESIQTINIK